MMDTHYPLQFPTDGASRASRAQWRTLVVKRAYASLSKWCIAPHFQSRHSGRVSSLAGTRIREIARSFSAAFGARRR